jgi:hypothetical protein
MMENLGNGNHGVPKEYLKKCRHCKEDFRANHMNREYCEERYGIKGYCKDRHNHPRSGQKNQFKQDVIESLGKTIVPSPIEDHAEVLYWLTIQLELDFDNVIPEFVIGGQYGKRIDFCIKKEKLKVGVELKLARHLEDDVTPFVNELLGQLDYASDYFKKQLVVAIAGNLNFRTRSRLSKLESLLLEKGIGLVFIQEIAEISE